MKATVSTNSNTWEEQVEKGGLFQRPKTIQRTGYGVSISVEFTEEERAILSKYNLWDTPVWTYKLPTNPELDRLMRAQGIPTEPIYQTTTITDLAAPANHQKPWPGETRVFDSSVEAFNFESDVKTKHLPAIKRLIEASNKSLGNSETLEY